MGVAAIHHGKRIRFYNAVDPVNQLDKEKQQGKAGNLVKQLTVMDAVILDELGYLPFPASGGALLFPGVELSRSTLADWVGWLGMALQPLSNRLARHLLQRDRLHVGETPVPQLDPGSGKTKKASPRGGFYNFVPNVLMLPLSLNHARNPYGRASLFYPPFSLIPMTTSRCKHSQGYEMSGINSMPDLLLINCLLFLVYQKINHWNHQQ